MAAVITAGAYTLASLGENAVIPARIIPFLAMLLGLLVLAHLAVRYLAAGADATMLPLAALLHGLGYVMITRLDEDLASLQTTWSIVVDRRVHRHAAGGAAGARPRPLPLELPARRRRAAAAAVAARPRVQRRRGPHLGQPRPDQLPARRVRQAAAGHLLRRLPRREPRADRREHVEGRPVAPARAAPPPADPAGVGLHRRGDGVRARPRLVAAVLRPVRRDDVGRHRAGQLPRDRA